MTIEKGLIRIGIVLIILWAIWISFPIIGIYDISSMENSIEHPVFYRILCFDKVIILLLVYWAVKGFAK